MVEEVIINHAKLKIVHTIIREESPTLIFLHDSLGCIDLWRDFPEKLGEATHCNIIVYDRQGYGKSCPFEERERENNYLEVEADVLNALIEKCGIEEAILFGHSDGGSIALIAAAKYPTYIKAVITEGAHIFVEDITLKGIREAVKTFQTSNLKEKLQKYHGDKTESVFWAWAKTWLSDEFKSWNIEGFLPQIKCPVLVIQGENDEYGSQAQVNGIVKQVSGKKEKYIIPSVGHTPHKEASEIVLKYVINFILRCKCYQSTPTIKL